jgi:hypothetical protein
MSAPISIPGSTGRPSHGTLGNINTAVKSDIDNVDEAITIIDELLIVLNKGIFEYPDNILI